MAHINTQKTLLQYFGSMKTISTAAGDENSAKKNIGIEKQPTKPGSTNATQRLLVRRSLFTPKAKQSIPKLTRFSQDEPLDVDSTRSSVLNKHVKTDKKEEVTASRPMYTTTPMMKKYIKIDKKEEVHTTQPIVSATPMKKKHDTTGKKEEVTKPSNTASLTSPPVNEVRSVKKKATRPSKTTSIPSPPVNEVKSIKKKATGPSKTASIPSPPVNEVKSVKTKATGPSKTASIPSPPVNEVKSVKAKATGPSKTASIPSPPVNEVKSVKTKATGPSKTASIPSPPVNEVKSIKKKDYVTLNKSKIYNKDIEDLRSGQWLSCKVIESYLFLLSVAAKQNNKHLHIWKSMMWTLYMEGGIQRIEKWLHKKIFNTDCDYIVQIINHSNSHWTVIWMDCCNKVLCHLDPLGKGKEGSHTLVKFQELIEYHTKKEFAWETWTNTVREMPLQCNNSDCGVFVCGYVRCLLGLSEGAWLDRCSMARELSARCILSITPGSPSVTAIGDCSTLNEDGDSDSGPREDMTDSDSSPAPYATTKEKYLNGLLKGPALSRRNVDVGYVHGRGRTAYAAKHFHAGDFVCEYGAVRRVYKSGQVDEGEERNAELGLGCYCLDAPYKGVIYTFDAAPKCNDPGRYINHASHHPNLRLMQPVLIGQQLRIGFIALKMIQKGDELFFNYHIKDKDIEWRNADAKKIGTTLQDADLGPSSTRSEWAKAIDIDEGLTEAVLTPSSTAAEWQKRIEPEEEALQTEEGTEEGIEEAQPGPLLTEEIHGQYEYRNKSENNKRLTRKRKRFRKYCPWEQCQKTPLKLSQHLIQFHKIMDADLRHRLCKSALKVESDTEEDSADDKTSWSSRKVRQKLSRHDDSDKETMSPPTKKYKREKDDSDSDYDGDYNEFTINEAQQDELLLVEQYHLGTCFATDFCQDSFFEYLTSEGRNPDTAKTATRSVNYFFTYKQYMQKTPLNIILNKANIREYVNHLQKVKMYAGTTVLERVGWLKAAVDYLTEDNSDNIRLHLRVQEVHKTIARLKSTISKKTIREQRATQARLSDAKIQTEESPKVFIESDEVVNAVNNAIRRAQTTTLSSHDHMLVIGYLAANLIYDNGQRPGVIQYMEINEYLERRSIDGHEITLVCKHKTGIQRGPAKVVVSNQMIISLLQAYYENIRIKLEAVNQQMTKRFFLLPSGNEFRKVYELMNTIALEFNISLLTPTSHRKLISTDASEHLSAEEMALLQKYMSHSSQTSDKYYQKTTFTAAIKSHKNIEVLSQKRRGFTAKQDKDLLMEWPNTNTPPLSVCRLIATKYRISKDAQQIQDRLKYLLKKNMS